MNSSRTAALATLAAVVLPLSACSIGGGETGPSVTNERVDPDAVEPLPSDDSEPPEESVELLEVSAQEYADRFGASEWALAWDLWVDAAKQQVDRATFVAFSAECERGGSPLEVSGATVVEPGEGAVRVDLARGPQTYVLRFEDDEWRWVPDDATLAALADASPTDLPACP